MREWNEAKRLAGGTGRALGRGRDAGGVTSEARDGRRLRARRPSAARGGVSGLIVYPCRDLPPPRATWSLPPNRRGGGASRLLKRVPVRTACSPHAPASVTLPCAPPCRVRRGSVAAAATACPPVLPHPPERARGFAQAAKGDPRASASGETIFHPGEGRERGGARLVGRSPAVSSIPSVPSAFAIGPRGGTLARFCGGSSPEVAGGKGRKARNRQPRPWSPPGDLPSPQRSRLSPPPNCAVCCAVGAELSSLSTPGGGRTIWLILPPRARGSLFP